MSNQLMQKTASLAAILRRNRLTKEAADQEITHETVLSQNSLGAEQTQEIRDGQYNVTADTAAAKNTPKDKVQEEPAGIQSLNKDPEAALNATGTSVENVTTNGDASAKPGDLAQSKAASYRGRLASILAMSKQASAKSEIMTGTEVMSKLASLTAESPKEAFDDAREAIIKLASTNPLFGICKARILEDKMWGDIHDLAQNAGIPLEKAAAELDAAQEANPEMAQELDDEATDEAIGDLADVEATAAELGPGIEEMAANATSVLGQEVTPDDILAAADEVTAQAEELGVEPEALIQAAVEQIQGGEEGEDAGVNEEDLANAQQILDAAAEQGISPEEVIQMAAGELGGDAGAEECADGECAGGECADGECKQASVNGGFMSKRAAYCAYVMANRGNY